jgi:hypothetical protein
LQAESSLDEAYVALRGVIRERRPGAAFARDDVRNKNLVPYDLITESLSIGHDEFYGSARYEGRGLTDL